MGTPAAASAAPGYPTVRPGGSPRLVAIVRPTGASVVKLMGGRAFRAPSTYELLYDDGGHVFLIDHSRAFTSKPDLAGLSAPQQYDRELWLRMAALTREDVESAVGAWLTSRQIECLLDRRDHMAKQITKLLRARGDKVVFLTRPADRSAPPSN